MTSAEFIYDSGLRKTVMYPEPPKGLVAFNQSDKKFYRPTTVIFHGEDNVRTEHGKRYLEQWKRKCIEAIRPNQN